MKKHLFLIQIFVFFLLVGSSLPLWGETPKEPGLVNQDDWTLVLIPDPQAYSRYGRTQGIFELVTAWIAENKSQFNIQQVVCVGDLVESNGLLEPDGFYANKIGSEMWQSVSRAFERLDGIYPYITCTGNHDYGPNIRPEGTHYGARSSETRDSHFNEHFPIDRNPALQGVLVETAENAFGVHTLENAAYEWTVPGGKKILAVSLEFCPRDKVLEWAKKLFARPEYKDHFGMIVTHSYILSYHNDCQRTGKEPYKITSEGNSGEQIWEKLVSKSPNIRMVLCGHISTADDIDGCTGFRVDNNEAEKPVYQLLFDTQAMGGGWQGNGGDGWIQLLEFNPEMTHVFVRTFSPLLAVSPASRDKEWLKTEKSEFEFDIEE